MDKDSIKNEAKKIMDDFTKALGKIELEESFNLERKKSFREESIPNELNEDFKERFLNNANKTNNDAIITSKGKWVK